QYGFEPDIITLAKGLGSGFPIGATLAKEKIAQAFSAGAHGSTFGGNPLAVTAGLATVKQLVKPDFLPKLRGRIDYFWRKLEMFCEGEDGIKALRGKGYLIGIEVEGEAIDYINRAREDHQLLIINAGPHVL